MWTIKILFGMIIFGLSSASTFKDKPDSIPVVTSEENINSVSATIRSLETNNGIQRSESTSNVEAREYHFKNLNGSTDFTVNLIRFKLRDYTWNKTGPTPILFFVLEHIQTSI